VQHNALIAFPADQPAGRLDRTTGQHGKQNKQATFRNQETSHVNPKLSVAEISSTIGVINAETINRGLRGLTRMASTCPHFRKGFTRRHPNARDSRAEIAGKDEMNSC